MPNGSHWPSQGRPERNEIDKIINFRYFPYLASSSHPEFQIAHRSLPRAMRRSGAAANSARRVNKSGYPNQIKDLVRCVRVALKRTRSNRTAMNDMFACIYCFSANGVTYLYFLSFNFYLLFYSIHRSLAIAGQTARLPNVLRVSVWNSNNRSRRIERSHSIASACSESDPIRRCLKRQPLGPKVISLLTFRVPFIRLIIYLLNGYSVNGAFA